MERGLAPPEARAGATTLAVTAAAVAILEILQRAAGAFELRPWVNVLIVVAVFFATLALTVLRHRKDREGRLGAALRSWPLPRMAEAEPYRLGVFPPRRDVAGPPDAEYVPRGDVDGRLHAALGKSSFVLVFGPARAGKSRTALEAARQIHPDAVVVAPRDAEGLRQLLELDPPLLSRRSRVPRWSRESRAVLWLDGLTRYLEALDDEVLDKIRDGNIPVTVLATIREDEYDVVLGGTGSEAEAAKAVVGAAQAFALPADGLGARLSSTGKEEQAPPPEPAERPADTVDRALRDPLFALPAGLTAVVLIVIGLIAVTSSLEQPVPLPLAQQADQLVRGVGDRIFGPVQADLHGTGEKSQLFVAAPPASEEDANGVPPSHEIRIYDPRGDELEERFRFQPDVDGGVFQYRGLDVIAGGSGEKLVGGYGFYAEANRALLPFMVYWDSASGEYRMEALQDAPPELSQGVTPKPAARPYLHAYRERVTLRDSDEDLTLSGYRVQDFSITQEPDRLVSALAIDPKTETETGRVEVQGSNLSFPGGDPTLFACQFTGGDRRPLVGSWSPAKDLQLELLEHWEPYIRTRECIPDT
jgi:hypothetical protein